MSRRILMKQSHKKLLRRFGKIIADPFLRLMMQDLSNCELMMVKKGSVFGCVNIAVGWIGSKRACAKHIGEFEKGKRVHGLISVGEEFGIPQSKPKVDKRPGWVAFFKWERDQQRQRLLMAPRG